MNVRNIVVALLLLSGIAAMLSGTGCANIVPPSGGPRDSLPPDIVAVNPANKTTNFKDDKITFRFNEYVELNDVYKNLVISPLPQILPQVDRHLKTVTFKLKDSLIPNTTYVINLRNVIKDVNEGNIMKDILYVVSTGNYFDSLELSGNVRIANTAKPDSTLTAMLYGNLEDSAVIKEKPRYIAKVDSSGNFLFRYLAPGKYKLYALKDESGMYKYTNPQAIFAFADSIIELKSGMAPPTVKLFAYTADNKAQENQYPEVDKKERRLKFKTNLQGTKQDILEAFTMNFESPIKEYDATKIMVSADSTFAAFTDYKLTLDSTRRNLTMNVAWTPGKQYNLILDKEFAKDSSGRQLLRNDTISFAANQRKDYGQVKITFKNIQYIKNPVLLVMQGTQLKNAFPITGNKLDIALYNPGEYDIQLLQDTNGNGKWDTGDFFGKRTQPERVVLFTRKMTVKPDWTSDFELNITPLD